MEAFKMRACIYNRCSTEEEAQKNALDVQVAESREAVEEKGWIVARQYIEAQSGTTAQRSEYQKMLRELEEDLFDVVVVKSIDRLTRSTKDWYLFLDRLMCNHKQLYLYLEHKFYTPEDSLLAGIKAILAEDFSRELSKKIKNAHRRRQQKKSGLNITVPMFGWDKVGKDEYVINPAEADAYRLAFAMAKEGKGFYSIANEMYKNGVRSKRGGRISEAQWRKMLYSPRAYGCVILRASEYHFESKQRICLPKEEWVVIEDALPPIVSKEYQQQVVELLQQRSLRNVSRKEKEKQRMKEPDSLSGKIYCAECGKPYYRSFLVVGGKKERAWKCSTFLTQGKKGCKNPHILQKDIEQEAMKRQIEYAEKKQRQLVQNFLDGAFDTTLGAFQTAFVEELSALQKQVQEKDLRAIQKVIIRSDGTMDILFYEHR